MIVINTIVLLIFTVFGYIWTEHTKVQQIQFQDVAKQINKEAELRSAEDERIKQMIDNKVSYKEFERLYQLVMDTNSDVKDLLKQTNATKK